MTAAEGAGVVVVRAEDASRGAVDLGEYFLYFSAFLIAACRVMRQARSA